MFYRLANYSDILQLATMRWQFRKEDDSMPDEEFITAFGAFMQRGFERGNWVVWVAEESVAFYQRAGFSLDEIKFEHEVRPYED